MCGAAELNALHWSSVRNNASLCFDYSTLPTRDVVTASRQRCTNGPLYRRTCTRARATASIREPPNTCQSEALRDTCIRGTLTAIDHRRIPPPESNPRAMPPTRYAHTTPATATPPVTEEAQHARTSIGCIQDPPPSGTPPAFARHRALCALFCYHLTNLTLALTCLGGARLQSACPVACAPAQSLTTSLLLQVPTPTPASNDGSHNNALPRRHAGSCTLARAQPAAARGVDRPRRRCRHGRRPRGRRRGRPIAQPGRLHSLSDIPARA